MKKILKYIYFILIVAALAAIGFYVNKHPVKLNYTNSSSSSLTDLGPAPEFTGIDHWINSGPLTMASLKGKVVLVDFWTYSCINCLRTLPYVTKWYNTYKDQGLVVIGVHTPEFAFEKDTANVERAVAQYGIQYPVAQDNEYGTWNAFSNQYWPAEYLIDKNGEIMYQDFGEGNYSDMENAIRQLLGLAPEANLDQSQDLSGIQSPEMYFGTNRIQYLDSSQTVSATAQNYTLPASLTLNNFALSGTWQETAEYATPTQPGGKIELKFHSAKLHMVAASPTPIALKIIVDGKAEPDVTVSASQLYTLFDSTDYADHTIEIDIPSSGLQVYTFTFG